MDNIEWKTRVDLAAAFRLADLYGWSDMLATHLSARIPGPDDHFLINPMGVLFEEITATDLIKLDVDGNILSDTSRSINPAGYTIHSAIHIGREDAGWEVPSPIGGDQGEQAPEDPNAGTTGS